MLVVGRVGLSAVVAITSITILTIAAACTGGGGALPADQNASSSGEKPNADNPDNISKPADPDAATSAAKDAETIDDGRAADGDATNEKCTPNSYVFCRCIDASEGVARCSSDGKQLEACSCDGG